MRGDPVQPDDRDVERLLATTDWEPEPDPVHEQASLARLVARLDRRRHRMRVLAQTSVALCVALIVCTAGTTWYHWTRPMAMAVQETQSLPLSATRLIAPIKAKIPGTWSSLLARLAGRDPRGLLASIHSVPGTDLLRAELSGGAGYVLLLPGQGVVGIVAPSSGSSELIQGFVAVAIADAPTVTAEDITAAREVASHDVTVALLGSPTGDPLQVASVYQPTTPYPGGHHMVPYDPFVLNTDNGYVRVRRIVAVPLKAQQESQTRLTALVDVGAHSIVGIVDATHIVGVILTDDPGPQVVLARQ
jgi:hypothetical protein